MIKAISNTGNVFEINLKDGVAEVNGKKIEFDSIQVGDGAMHWLINNKSYRIEITERIEKKIIALKVNGKPFRFTLKDKMDDLLHELGMDNAASTKVNDLKAPMPGLVVDIRVSEGQQVKKGDIIIVLEAMKMENALKAIADVTVLQICAKKGAAVEKNQVLVLFS
jgi:acetyl/propionyl-CoA carboxylase alpha subunit